MWKLKRETLTPDSLVKLLREAKSTLGVAARQVLVLLGRIVAVGSWPPFSSSSKWPYRPPHRLKGKCVRP